MLSQTHQEGTMSLFRTRIMRVISINLFFQWYGEEFHLREKSHTLLLSLGWCKILSSMALRRILVGIRSAPPSTFLISGSWPLDPYLSFAISAFVELLAYILVHLILDRVGRKVPYCGFAVLFGVVAISILPVQKFMENGSAGKIESIPRERRSVNNGLSLFKRKRW